MTDWTTAQVQGRLEHAADVFAQLPAVKPKGYFNPGPSISTALPTMWARSRKCAGRARPPRQITEAEEAMLWLRWLEKDDARLVWLRANRTPWKPICWELGISRARRTGAGNTASRSSYGG